MLCFVSVIAAPIQVKRRLKLQSAKHPSWLSLMTSGKAVAAPSSNQDAVKATESTILKTQADEREDLLDEYFASTKLLQVIQDFMTSLAVSYKTDLRFPANPYPELLNVMRMHELRQSFAMQGDSSSTPLELAILRDHSFSTPPQFQVCSVEHEQFVLPIWGVKATLEQLTASHLHGLLEHLNSTFQSLLVYKEFTDDECKVVAYGVLVGDAIFGTTRQDLPTSSFELETHVFVFGAHLEKAMTVFARFLLKQLHEVTNAATTFESLTQEEAANYCGCISSNGILVCITAWSATGLNSQNSNSTVWTMDRVVENRAAFVSAVKTALVTNSQITLTQYDCAKIHSSRENLLSQVVRAFFFHFALENGGKTIETKNAISRRRSFITGSRALASGIFFHSQGCLEIVSRFQAEAQHAREEELKNVTQKKKQVTESINQSASVNSEAKPRSVFSGILRDTIEHLRRHNLSNEGFRQQVSSLVECFAFSLGLLVEAYEVVEIILCRATCSAVLAAIVQTSFTSLSKRVDRFLEESCSFPTTSVMLPVSALMRDFHRQVQAVSTLMDDQQANEFVEALRCVNELLLIVIRVGFDDFLRLVRSTASSASIATAKNLPTEPKVKKAQTTMDEIDVLRALEVAVEECKYPSTIIFEAVFAQAVIDSCLDVALESAVMNTVATCLPPNPFIDMSSHLQVFALRQLVWQHELQPTPLKTVSKIARPGSLPLFSLEGKGIYAFNTGLLHLVSSDQVAATHRWLKQHHILHEGTYKPAKSSYSAAIFPTMLIYQALAYADGKSKLLKEIDCVEQYVIEGKEYSQALLFFAEAVRKDLRRIVGMRGSCPSDGSTACWHFRAEANILDPHDQIVTSLDLSSSTLDENLDKIVEEAAQVYCLVQIIVQIVETQTQGDSSTLTIHKLTKAYAFHHKSTGEAKSTTRISPLTSFRVLEYGIFFSKQNAMLCMQGVQESVSPSTGVESWGLKIPREEWTPYSSVAIQHEDIFLLYELDLAHKNTATTVALPSDDYELTSRLVGHSAILQLYSLDQAARWLLDSLQTESTTSTAGKAQSSDTLPPAAIFNIYHRLALQIITEMEQLVVELNSHLCFLYPLSGYLASFQTCVGWWQTIQPLTEEHLENQRQQQQKPPEHLLLTPREDPMTITRELIGSLRTTWIHVLFLRFSYQRTVFANARSSSETDK